MSVEEHCEKSSRYPRTLVNVGEDTTLGDGDVAQELVQFLIVADGKLKVTGNDTGLLVVTSGVTSQLQNFSSQVLQNCSEVDGSTGTNTLGVVALAQQTVDTANREGQASLGGTAKHDTLVRTIDENGTRPEPNPNKSGEHTTERSCCR